jgi:hypothetical protein
MTSAGKLLNLVLLSVQIDRVRHARITNNRVRAEAEMTTGRNEAIAPISEAVAVAFNRNRRGSLSDNPDAPVRKRARSARLTLLS